MNLQFYRNKKVLLTGHTGFKGTWLCEILKKAGADVIGYSLLPPTEPNLFNIVSAEDGMESLYGDVRDSGHLTEVMNQIRPEIVIHLAAQPLVRYSYQEPRLTFETNIMGTVNLMEAVRSCGSVRSLVNVTTDKVYANEERKNAFCEEDPLNGFDPYSNSKSCSDLVTQSYRRSFLAEEGCAVSTVRAGNVIGGGDFAEDRLVPDCVRAATEKKKIMIRNPQSVRPFQHVLEPLAAYLLIAGKQWEDPSLAGAWNVGPERDDCITAGKIADLFCHAWNEEGRIPAGTADPLGWEAGDAQGPHEASFLLLDSTKLKEKLSWKPVWEIEDAVSRTVEWTKAWLSGEDAAACLHSQIDAYFKESGNE